MLLRKEPKSDKGLYRRSMDTLGKHFREIAKPVFERHGFGHGELLARWPEIVGEALAQHCEPEKIRWPRRPGEQAQKTGGTLHVTAAPGRGLDVHYEAPRMIERINRFFGYGAIATVKITQGTLARHPAGRSTTPAPAPERLVNCLAAVEDEGLKDALTRLAAGVASRRPSSPQGQ
jgi:hypothetical protein